MIERALDHWQLWLYAVMMTLLVVFLGYAMFVNSGPVVKMYLASAEISHSLSAAYAKAQRLMQSLIITLRSF